MAGRSAFGVPSLPVPHTLVYWHVLPIDVAWRSLDRVAVWNHLRMVHWTSTRSWRLPIWWWCHYTIRRLGKVWRRALEHLRLGHVVLGQPCTQLRWWKVRDRLWQLSQWFEWNWVHAVFVRRLWCRRVGRVGVCWSGSGWGRAWRASLGRWRGSVLNLWFWSQGPAWCLSLVVALNESNTFQRK